MTGLERNADVVVMSSYAPLFAHEDGWQWTPNLIWFDNLRVLRHAELLRAAALQPQPRRRGPARPVDRCAGGRRASSPGSTPLPRAMSKAGEVILKVVNTQAEPSDRRRSGSRVQASSSPRALAITLSGELADENSLDDPKKVAPVTSTVSGVGRSSRTPSSPYSLTVLRLGRAN